MCVEYIKIVKNYFLPNRSFKLAPNILKRKGANKATIVRKYFFLFVGKIKRKIKNKKRFAKKNGVPDKIKKINANDCGVVSATAFESISGQFE